MNKKKLLTFKKEDAITLHEKAYQCYQDQGETRTLKKVAKEMGLKYSNILEWSTSYKWKKKIIDYEEQQEIEEAARLEMASPDMDIEKIETLRTINARKKYRKDIEKQIHNIKVMLKDVETEIYGNRIFVTSIQDIKILYKIYEDLIKLDLKLAGDDILDNLNKEITVDAFLAGIKELPDGIRETFSQTVFTTISKSKN